MTVDEADYEKVLDKDAYLSRPLRDQLLASAPPHEQELAKLILQVAGIRFLPPTLGELDQALRQHYLNNS